MSIRIFVSFQFLSSFTSYSIFSVAYKSSFFIDAIRLDVLHLLLSLSTCAHNTSYKVPECDVYVRDTLFMSARNSSGGLQFAPFLFLLVVENWRDARPPNKLAVHFPTASPNPAFERQRKKSQPANAGWTSFEK